MKWMYVPLMAVSLYTGCTAVEHEQYKPEPMLLEEKEEVLEEPMPSNGRVLEQTIKDRREDDKLERRLNGN